MSAPPPRKPSATFRPHFTLTLLYLAFFFLAYSLLLVAPELMQVEPPANPVDDEAALAEVRETIRRVAGPRLPVALLLALATLLLGVRQGLLPGISRPDLR
ncbi:MAG: hypothetical protein JRH16_13995 [Deltaproteobacteria bacterium]|nr:hypothetical protein [Deltaproteobacteria bacterium]MBW2359766.1 hypothetical protein [Deltaproteobacteria bacterium]